MTARVHLPGSLSFVTGAGRGIGRATALALAAEGSRVLCADLDGASAAATASACDRITSGAVGYPVDTSDREVLATLFRRVLDDHGLPDVVVNNAGVGMSGRLADMDLADWDWIRSINLDGVLHGSQLFGPAMVHRGSGHVVNLSSGLGFMPRATEPAYCTTKAAVLMLSQCLRADWAPHGVGVTAVCPGVINTPIIDHTRFKGDVADRKSVERTKKVFRRGHPPEKVADAIVDAVKRDKPMVAVGWESKLGWGMHRLLPLGAQQLLARQSPR